MAKSMRVNRNKKYSKKRRTNNRVLTEKAPEDIFKEKFKKK